MIAYFMCVLNCINYIYGLYTGGDSPFYVRQTQFSNMSELVSTRSKTVQEASKSKPLCSTPSERPLSQSVKKKRATGATKETDLKAKEEEYRFVVQNVYMIRCE